MAVTLNLDDLKYPTGELQPRMFPDGDIDTVLATWLTEAIGLTTDDTAASHYVYWRGYSAVANRIAATPTSQSTSTGSHSTTWGKNRIDDMRSLADYHKGEFDKIVESSSLTQPQAYFGRVSV